MSLRMWYVSKCRLEESVASSEAKMQTPNYGGHCVVENWLESTQLSKQLYRTGPHYCYMQNCLSRLMVWRNQSFPVRTPINCISTLKTLKWDLQSLNVEQNTITCFLHATQSVADLNTKETAILSVFKLRSIDKSKLNPSFERSEDVEEGQHSGHTLKLRTTLRVKGIEVMVSVYGLSMEWYKTLHIKKHINNLFFPLFQ